MKIFPKIMRFCEKRTKYFKINRISRENFHFSRKIVIWMALSPILRLCVLYSVQLLSFLSLYLSVRSTLALLCSSHPNPQCRCLCLLPLLYLLLCLFLSVSSDVSLSVLYFCICISISSSIIPMSLPVSPPLSLHFSLSISHPISPTCDLLLFYILAAVTP
jgi:hypothetical protein